MTDIVITVTPFRFSAVARPCTIPHSGRLRDYRALATRYRARRVSPGRTGVRHRNSSMPGDPRLALSLSSPTTNSLMYRAIVCTHTPVLLRHRVGELGTQAHRQPGPRRDRRDRLGGKHAARRAGRGQLIGGEDVHHPSPRTLLDLDLRHRQTLQTQQPRNIRGGIPSNRWKHA